MIVPKEALRNYWGKETNVKTKNILVHLVNLKRYSRDNFFKEKSKLVKTNISDVKEKILRDEKFEVFQKNEGVVIVSGSMRWKDPHANPDFDAIFLTQEPVYKEAVTQTLNTWQERPLSKLDTKFITLTEIQNLFSESQRLEEKTEKKNQVLEYFSETSSLQSYRRKKRQQLSKDMISFEEKLFICANILSGELLLPDPGNLTQNFLDEIWKGIRESEIVQMGIESHLQYLVNRREDRRKDPFRKRERTDIKFWDTV